MFDGISIINRLERIENGTVFHEHRKRLLKHGRKIKNCGLTYLQIQ